jgi:hypothetical protein
MPERIDSPENSRNPGSPRPDDNKPGFAERALTAAKDTLVPVAATVIIGATSFAAHEHPRHELAGSRHDRSGQTAEAIRPSAADRLVAKASAPENEESPGQQLEKWMEKDGDEALSAVGEDLEKRKEEF